MVKYRGRFYVNQSTGSSYRCLVRPVQTNSNQLTCCHVLDARQCLIVSRRDDKRLVDEIDSAESQHAVEKVDPLANPGRRLGCVVSFDSENPAISDIVEKPPVRQLSANPLL